MMAGLLWYRSYMDSLANTSGYYPDIHAGHADRVTELTLEEPYLVRETPAGYNQLELAQIIGGTMIVEGSLQSVEATAHVTVGKNLLDKSGMQYTPANAYIGAATVTGGADGSLVLNAGSYVFSVSGVDAVTGLYVADSSGTNIAVRYNNTFLAFTLTETTAVKLTIFKTGVTAEILEGYNYQLEFGSTATAYEPYTKTTTSLANITLRGISKTVDGVLSYDGDTYDPDGTVTRYYGMRAHQAGDESLTDAVTDGTNTVYKLTTPITESAAPYTATQTVEAGGTVQFVTNNNIPVGNVSIYRRV